MMAKKTAKKSAVIIPKGSAAIRKNLAKLDRGKKPATTTVHATSRRSGRDLRETFPPSKDFADLTPKQRLKAEWKSAGIDHALNMAEGIGFSKTGALKQILKWFVKDQQD
jgi:hypothetical protein